MKHIICCSTTSNDYMALTVFALVHILTVFGLVCDVMQLSIMEHNGITLKEKLVRFASIEEKHNGVSFGHNFLMPSSTVYRTLHQVPKVSTIEGFH